MILIGRSLQTIHYVAAATLPQFAVETRESYAHERECQIAAGAPLALGAAVRGHVGVCPCPHIAEQR